jgi:hypothetical protein
MEEPTIASSAHLVVGQKPPVRCPAVLWCTGRFVAGPFLTCAPCPISGDLEILGAGNFLASLDVTVTRHTAL